MPSTGERQVGPAQLARSAAMYIVMPWCGVIAMTDESSRTAMLPVPPPSTVGPTFSQCTRSVEEKCSQLQQGKTW